VLRKFWSLSAVPLFVDFQIIQVPSYTETERHSSLFCEEFFSGPPLLPTGNVFFH